MASETQQRVGGSSPEDVLERAAVDAAVRRPVMFLFLSGAGWLVIGSLLSFIASLKFHAPDVMDVSWFSYGRVQPAATNSLLYGWAIQVGLGVGIWMMARLSRSVPKAVWVLEGSTVVWNLAVTFGVIGILGGGQTAMEWMEMPAAVWPVLLLSFVLIASSLIVQFRARRQGATFVSQWYLLAVAFWFPWLYLTTNVVLHHVPGSAVTDAATNSWYVLGMVYLFLVPLGLAVTHYLLPKVLGRPLHSHQLGLIGFWGLAALGGWMGAQKLTGGPVPTGLPALAGMASILLLIPAIAVLLNHWRTARGCGEIIGRSPSLRFTVFALFSFAVLALATVLLSTFWFGQTAQFTQAWEGLQMLALVSFYTMAMFGAIYFIVPRLTGCEWLSARFIGSHFWLSAWGAGFLSMLLIVSGFAQGGLMNDPANWNQPMEEPLMVGRGYLIGRTLMWSMMSIGNLLFFGHLVLMSLRLGRRSSEPTLLGHAEHAA